ncbi:DUF6314 family protein [Profundibacterium mesophilum]|uniref:DUF6314 domain-containing protein n=1 Tax=Profundibacterium mesophilum KAUST100406-0324 TaxID=1037889 RepID=A0A921NTD6_9RHOB|nr:DUF6314 family protein [Profundibacterium mesophilum]KAF0674801.1 hypothetical protein PMES_02877 [Profundibacterium mesophilum KAUST100406-0324]
MTAPITDRTCREAPRLRDFEGDWTLSRKIEDRRARLSGRLDGTARWQPAEGGLRMGEAGLLRFGAAAPIRAERGALWMQDGPDIRVHFEDGRFFHLIAPRAGRAGAVHECAPDRYEVTYDFRDWPRWSALWTVTGPRKDYVMRSDYAPGERPARNEKGAP